jgi:hypothetical protein
MKFKHVVKSTVEPEYLVEWSLEASPRGVIYLVAESSGIRQVVCELGQGGMLLYKLRTDFGWLPTLPDGVIAFTTDGMN